MSLSLSKFLGILLFVLFIFIVFLTQKTIAIKFYGSIQTIITNERRVKDVLVSKKYPSRIIASDNKNLYLPLHEHMVIELKSDGSIHIVP